MMRSMYSAVTGLRTHQGKLDTIGNNIANVNTVGFKKGQVTFKEIFNQTVRGASSATKSGVGGLNPQQIGMGVNTGAINTIHTRGAGQRTDNPTDLAIEGNGFFVVSDDINGNNRYYTRAGNFNLDNQGNLVTSEGFRVLGYQANPDGTFSDAISGLRINASETVAPILTENLELRGNLDSNYPLNTEHETDTIIRDSLGNAYSIKFAFERTADNTWNIKIKRFTDVATGRYTEDLDGKIVFEGTGAANPQSLSFSSAGKLLSIGGKNIDTDSPALDIKINDGIVFQKDKNKMDINEPINNQVKFGQGGSGKISILSKEKTRSYDNLTQYANETTAKTYAKDGATSGNLRGFSIGADGIITGAFDNGDTKALGRVALAKFDNSMGLEKIANNLYKDSRNSGEAQVGKAGSAGYGPIASGTLEMSNVDLALEFTEMITTQRGFQANSRVITTSDEMLQELVNIKR